MTDGDGTENDFTIRLLDVAELHVALVGKEQLVHNKYSSRHSWKLNTLVLHPRFQPGMASIAPLTGHSGHDIWSKAFFKAWVSLG